MCVPVFFILLKCVFFVILSLWHLLQIETSYIKQHLNTLCSLALVVVVVAVVVVVVAAAAAASPASHFLTPPL